MGEMADWIAESWGDGPPDWRDDYIDGPIIYHQKEIDCKYCGKRGFIWTETPKGWRLQGMDGKIHNCY